MRLQVFSARTMKETVRIKNFITLLTRKRFKIGIIVNQGHLKLRHSPLESRE